MEHGGALTLGALLGSARPSLSLAEDARCTALEFQPIARDCEFAAVGRVVSRVSKSTLVRIAIGLKRPQLLTGILARFGDDAVLRAATIDDGEFAILRFPAAHYWIGAHCRTGKS